MFDTENSADFYAMSVADFNNFMVKPQSARRAIHCAITACHLAEWVWHDWLKKCDEVKTKLGITNEKAFYEYLNSHVWLKPSTTSRPTTIHTASTTSGLSRSTKSVSSGRSTITIRPFALAHRTQPIRPLPSAF